MILLDLVTPRRTGHRAPEQKGEQVALEADDSEAGSTKRAATAKRRTQGQRIGAGAFAQRLEPGRCVWQAHEIEFETTEETPTEGPTGCHHPIAELDQELESRPRHDDVSDCIGQTHDDRPIARRVAVLGRHAAHCKCLGCAQPFGLAVLIY